MAMEKCEFQRLADSKANIILIEEIFGEKIVEISILRVKEFRNFSEEFSTELPEHLSTCPEDCFA